MTRAPRLVLPLLFACLLAPAVAGADDAIDADRPDVTNGPRALAAGVWQLEAGATHIGAGGDAAMTVGEGLLRHGVGHGLELRLDVPTWNHLDSGSGSSSGWGNAGLGAKWLLPGATERFATGVVVDLSLPTGAEAFGGGSTGGSAVLAADVGLGPRFDLGLNAGGTRASGQDALALSASCACSLDARTGAWAEWAGTHANGAFAHQFDTGLTRQVGRNVQLDARVGFGFGEADGQRTLGAGVTRRW